MGGGERCLPIKGTHKIREENIAEMCRWGEKALEADKLDTTFAFNALLNFARMKGFSYQTAKDYAQNAQMRLVNGKQKVSMYGESSSNGTQETGTATPESGS